jgi:hypothetical protein
MSSSSVGHMRRSPRLYAALAIIAALLASALLVPALAETPQPPPSAGTPQAPAASDAATPAAPAAEIPSGEVPIKATIPIVYLGKQYEEPLPLSYSEKIITDKGIQGARLIIKEANQAGGFVGYAFELVEAFVPANGDVVA